MKATLKIQTQPQILLVALALGLALSYSCKSNPSALDKTGSTLDSAGNAVPQNPDGMIIVRGTVTEITSKKMIIKTGDSTQTLTLADSLHLYASSPSSVAAIKNTSFIGVTTQKQADGSDLATEIHIFPEELRGLGEGSFMMDDKVGAGSRMTNGAASRMTNGAASRMSNGEVQKANGTSLVIQYQGKFRTVKVPANTPVSVYTVTNKKLSIGVKLVALAKKDDSGKYSTSKILLK